MIKITVFKNSKGYQGFICTGHAGYADAGSDIVCAGVSALVVNAVNSIEIFTGDSAEANEENGRIEFKVHSELSEKSILLLDSMILGLQEIQKSYGNEYIQIIFKEV